MKAIDDGHTYELAAGNRLSFVRKDGGIVVEGTTYEEVLTVLIHRLTEAYSRLPCEESIRAVHFLREALAALEDRTAKRVRAGLEGTERPHSAKVSSQHDFLSACVLEVDQIDLAPN
jgi:hypothetical protein